MIKTSLKMVLEMVLKMAEVLLKMMEVLLKMVKGSGAPDASKRSLYASFSLSN